MHDLETNTSYINSEFKYNNNPNPQNAIILILKGWLFWQNEDKNDSREYLSKSYQTALSSYKQFTADFRLKCLFIFIAVETERYDSANDVLDSSMAYKSYYKINEPTHYMLLHFLYAYLEIKQKRLKSANKYSKILNEAAATNNPYIINLLNGILSFETGDFEDAFGNLAQAWKNGCRSVFMFNVLHKYYKRLIKSNASLWKNTLLMPVLHWAAKNNAEINDILYEYREELNFAFQANIKLGEQLHRMSRNPQILKEICLCKMKSDDYSLDAYNIYKETENQQLHVDGMYHYLFKTAFLFGIEDLHHYSMAEYLQSTEPDTELKMFVYHILLTDPKMSDLIPPLENDILQFCTYCIEQNYSGRIVNSLYYFFWKKCMVMNLDTPQTRTAEIHLKKNLTFYEISINNSNSAVQYIYVTEPEKKGMEIYTPALVNGKKTAVISAVSQNFRYTCLNAGRKQILNESLTIKRMIHGADTALHLYFFKQGVRDRSLLLFLANHYMDIITSDETNNLEKESIEVLEAALNDSELSLPYKARLNVALGSLYYKAGQFKRALECYGAVDENHLEDAYISQVLNVFMKTKEWARVAGLILRKSRSLPEKVLFDAVLCLSADYLIEFHPVLAESACTLIIKSWYDKKLLNIVLKFYKGSQADWQSLSHALSVLNISEPKLDEIILQNSIWTHQFDAGAQKIFAKIAANDHLNPIVGQYIYFCIYEMMIEDQKPTYEVLEALEKIYSDNLFEDKDFLCFGLSHVYLQHGIDTFHSEQILNDAIHTQENKGILFPIFNQKRDKIPQYPYIEKYRSFLYRSLPDKNVWLYYKIDKNTFYTAVQMFYLKFGLYIAILPHFYNEQIFYYFSEELPTGNITTREKEIKNSTIYLDEKQADKFFVINNALIYEQLFKHEQAESIISSLLKDTRRVRGGII